MSIYEYQFYEYAQKKNVGFVKPDVHDFCLSSNTIGLFLASVSSFISSSVKASSFANSIEIFSVFTIIDVLIQFNE